MHVMDIQSWLFEMLRPDGPPETQFRKIDSSRPAVLLGFQKPCCMVPANQLVTADKLIIIAKL